MDLHISSEKLISVKTEYTRENANHLYKAHCINQQLYNDQTSTKLPIKWIVYEYVVTASSFPHFAQVNSQMHDLPNSMFALINKKS